jgi:hypothetical protein
MKHLLFTAAAGILVAGAAFGQAAPAPAPEGAKTNIVSPADGATVSNPVTVVFGLEGMGLAPAGAAIDKTGHHHLLITIDPGGFDMTTPLHATDQIVHFDGGQTQVTTDLPAGTHTLQLLLGDWTHVPHDPPVMSEAITITVE